MRASSVVNCQSAFTALAFRSPVQDATSAVRLSMLGMRRSRHWLERTDSSDSAMSSQLPCLGVRARFDRQLLGRLVEANDGSFWVVRTPVDVEHVLHAGDEVGVGVGRNDPLFLEVRLEDVFFRIRPMVLSLALATIPSSTTFSSSRRSVQCARPSGGFEQATAISFASASPSKIFGRAHAGLYCRVSTASNPSSTRRLRARETLLRLVS